MLRADTGESYYPGAPHGEASYSSASQTAWALLALMAAGEVDNPSVARGVAYLIATQDRDGNWDEPWHGGRVPARLLPALSRLPRLLSL